MNFSRLAAEHKATAFQAVVVYFYVIAKMLWRPVRIVGWLDIMTGVFLTEISSPSWLM